MKKISFVIFAVGLFWIALQATNLRAEEAPGLSEFISQEISTMSRAVGDAPGSQQEEPEYFFKQFMIRVQAMVGFSVPWVVSFQVVPQVELVWLRNAPSP